MKDLSLVQVLALLVFVMYPLIQFVVERLRRGAAARPVDDVPAVRSLPLPRPQAQLWASVAAPADPVPTPQTVPVPSPSPRRHSPRRKPLGDRQELRRAIVLNTVLGPCRTDDPPG